jgi:hypothetical protein
MILTHQMQSGYATTSNFLLLGIYRGLLLMLTVFLDLCTVQIWAAL